MTSVTAIVDARAPLKAIETLQQYCNVFQFQSSNSTYDAIACHPDIFLFQGTSNLVVAPNAPGDFIGLLKKKNINFVNGDSLVGEKLDNSTAYNCIETKTHFFHKQGFTDKVISELTNKHFVSLPQAYTRCSLMALNEKSFITSDRGIEKALVEEGFNCFFCDPSSIVLPPYKHGFIGGCLGLHSNNLFVLGSLKTLENYESLITFIQAQNLEIIELYDGPLYDGGGIFFV